jgi:hypothetical protein
MSLSDCPKCWDTPCQCGWEYKNISSDNFAQHIAKILQYRTKEEAKEIVLKCIEYINLNKNWQSLDND